MARQIDLFQLSPHGGVVPVKECWALYTDAKSTAESQKLKFECAGILSSQWLINAIDKNVLYFSGDQSRRPSSDVIDEACRILFEMTHAQQLFPLSLEKVIYQNAWAKGADAAFNDEPIDSNPFAPSSVQSLAWINGHSEN